MNEEQKLESLWLELQAAIKAHRDALIARNLAEHRYSRQRRVVVEQQESERRRQESATILQPKALQYEPDGDVLWA